MFISPDPNGIRRNYTVTVHEKTYTISNIHFYKDNKILVSSDNGWLEEKTENGIRDITSLDIPAALYLKRNSTAFDGTVYIVSIGKDWAGKLSADLYIPADLLGIRFAGYELQNSGRRLHAIWKGNNGIYLEPRIKNLDEELHNIQNEYDKLHQKISSGGLIVLREDIIRTSLNKLTDLSEAYFEERNRLANLTVEDLDFAAFGIEQEEPNVL